MAWFHARMTTGSVTFSQATNAGKAGGRENRFVVSNLSFPVIEYAPLVLICLVDNSNFDCHGSSSPCTDIHIKPTGPLDTERNIGKNASFNNLVIYVLDRCVQNKLFLRNGSSKRVR